MFSLFLDLAGSKEVMPAASLYLNIFLPSIALALSFLPQENKKIESRRIKVESSLITLQILICNVN